MQKRRLREKVTFVVLAAALAIVGGQPAFAETSSSNNYQVTETEFSSGGELNSCSAGYCARVSIGSAQAGEAASAGGAAAFGSVTPSEPTLEVMVEPGLSNLGVLTTETTGSKIMIVRIRSYLSDGYQLQITGTPPKYGDYILNTPSTPTNSQPGTEQFGINVAENTTPALGAAPIQVPDAQTSFGEADADYNQPNKFMYSSGDVVAASTRASGRTDYTVSMIVNIAANTPAGDFTGDYSAVVVPLY